MEIETLFTSSKWDILKCLEKGKKSPIDLARESNTSVANISQQLRLLELAGFVKSERISNRDKGQPRVLYSLAMDYSYIVVSADSFVQKKFLKLDRYQKNIIKIWFVEDRSLHYYIEKFYWAIEKQLDKLNSITIDVSDPKPFKVFLSGEKEEVKKAIKELTIDGPIGEKTFVTQSAKEMSFDEPKYVTFYGNNFQEKK